MSSQAPVLKLYNTLTREKQPFEPLDDTNVRMYVCGPTVYDHAHIGNARPLIVFDVLYRLLRHVYGESHVTYVRNITDVDDKINARAAERGISIRELTEETNKVFQADVKALGCLEPTVQPRATEHIAQMIEIIEKLIASGHAYAVPGLDPGNGNVLFDVPSWKDYGRLSRRPLDEMIAGARVDVAPYKRGDMDFVLWKPSKEDEPGWESPWGRGRPGWHLECSAMSWKHLGETFDIHGGGIDLVFPHHENEIAQSRCAFGRDVMATVWMHNGFLQVEGEKMSKSLGNFVTIRELLDTEKFGGRKWPGEVLRLAMLRTHYRQPIDWTVKALEEAYRDWISFGEIFRENLGQRKIDDEFLACLGDDLNTPGALTCLYELRKASKSNTEAGRLLAGSLEHLGFFHKMTKGVTATLSLPVILDGVPSRELLHDISQLSGDFELRFIADHLHKTRGSDASALIKLLNTFVPGTIVDDIRGLSEKIESIEVRAQDRLTARAAKNWAESDRIRDEIALMGIALKDNKDGTTTWEVRR